MKKILLPLMALLMLASGGAGAYFYMGKSEASTGDAVAAKSEEDVAAEKAEIKNTTYVPMQAIVLPIIDRDGVAQTISLIVSLEVKDPAKAEEVKNELPKLADAFLSDMYGTLSKSANMENGVVRVSTLKQRLSEITDRVMGKDVVAGVLLQVLQQHRG